ncbi:MAG: tRNA (adenine-N1)-methyltransferase [Actinobacteria bacterium]|nr:tRNA (adenine-N1)-methyltransferase [Actinomycetota bacterium]MCL5447390.1 tRNA (adenine-N1)-methyltransferase [Actinomycetota bacterium]
MTGDHEDVLAAGEDVVFYDTKGHRHLVRLREDGHYHMHDGVIDHADAIGNIDGAILVTSKGVDIAVVRPTLSDRIFEMPRGAQVIYPKDIGSILVQADVGPGMSVLEAGVGSGALSMALLRVGAVVHGYELREDFASRAIANVERAVGGLDRYTVELRDVYEGIGLVNLDRILLDLPEPWRVVAHAEQALKPGSILLAYLPSIDQVMHLRQALLASRFGLVSTYEVLQRGWYIEDRSVRPDHRMVAHTGFITTARLLASNHRKFKHLTLSPGR